MNRPTSENMEPGSYDPLDELAESWWDSLVSDPEISIMLKGEAEKKIGRPMYQYGDDDDPEYYKASTEVMEDMLKRMIVINRQGMPSKEHPTDIVVTVTPELV